MPQSAHAGSPTLILVPTEQEEVILAALGGFPAGLGLFARCGFGPVGAAARAADRLAVLQPARVLLVGIAGSFDLERAPVGCARAFDAIALDGVGAESGERELSSATLGFAQARDARGEPIYDRVALTAAGPRAATSESAQQLLLSVCAASGDRDAARRRARRFPGVLAEDMEAFGVALACAARATPLAVVRGISNAAGDRNVRAWDVHGALRAARELALAWLHEERTSDGERA
ncbi:MAG: futalosine hydrolase [Planctomycetota bacterium]